MPRNCGLILLALGLLLPGRLRAHGNLHGQIAAVTEEVARRPADAALFLKRAELHRLHRDWPAAHADLTHATRLDPKLAAVDFQRGLLHLDSAQPRAAVESLDQFLHKSPRSGPALLARARAWAQLGENAAAATDFSTALQLLANPQPEHFLERARAQAGPRGAGFAAAVRGLDEGIQRLGPLTALHEAALSLEVKQGRFAAALARLEQIASRSPRKDIWLARRGEVLAQAGRAEEARAAYEQARREMEKLSSPRRALPATVELEKKILTALAAQVNAPSRANPEPVR